MDEIRDSSVESKLDSKLAQILVNFGLLSVARIIVLHLVDITQRRHFSPASEKDSKVIFEGHEINVLSEP